MINKMLLSGQHPLLNTIKAPIYFQNPRGYEFETWMLPDVETYFQAMKCLFITQQEGRDWEECWNYVTQAGEKKKSWQEAKKRARNLKIDVVAWDRAAFGIMLMAHTAKFTQILTYQRELLRTGSKVLVEHRPDPIWGDNMDGTGLNLCGKSLMIVRDKVLS